MDVSRGKRIAGILRAAWSVNAVNRLLIWALPPLVVALMVGCGSNQGTNPQDTLADGTGFGVGQQFESFYHESGGSLVFGHALADPFNDLENGRLVQYFQRMRLEYDPPSGQIIVSPLGRWALPDPANQLLAPIPENDGASASDDQQLSIEGEFSNFYRLHQGDLLFGQPISPQLDEGGVRAQYFENARLEWHPEAPLEFRVQVGRLGEAHYRQVGIFQDPGRSLARPADLVREAVVSANVSAPILYTGDEQTIFVNVETPEGQRPVEGVEVRLTVAYGNESESLTLPLTNEFGHTKGRLHLPGSVPGQKVQVKVSAFGIEEEQIGATSLSFKTWW